MIPAARIVWLMLALLLLAIALGFFPEYADSWKFVIYVVLGVLFADAFSVLGKKSIRAERYVMHALSLGAWSNVELTLHNHYRYPIKLEIFDHVPNELEFEGLPINLTIPPRNWAKVKYRVKPIIRGRVEFKKVQIRIISVLGLWKKNLVQPLVSEVRNYPNFSTRWEF
jgi:uncharacterized protein (DUF58 family)